MNYLELAVKIAVAKPIYYTPTKVKEYVNKNKFDFLIKNPPYDKTKGK
jgi:type I restriction-modification system DNA methylase subunit